MTLGVDLPRLPDGTNCPATVVLGMPASQIEVRITNNNDQKVRAVRPRSQEPCP